MKNLVIAFILLAMLAALPAFAEQLQEFTGTVDSISPIDPERGADSGDIYVTDAFGKEISVAIDTSTSVMDEFSKKISSSDIEDGDTVRVMYSESDMGNKAATISRVVDKSKGRDNPGVFK